MTWGRLTRQTSKWGCETSVVRELNLLQNIRVSPSGLSKSRVVGARVDFARWTSRPFASRAKKQTLDRDVIVSVLEAAATRRDAKGYLQKYTAKQPKSSAPPTDAQPFRQADGTTARYEERATIDVAVVKLRLPQQISSHTLSGIAKTLTQLRALGLISLVVVDCGPGASRDVLEDEALRLCGAVNSFGVPGAKLADHVFVQPNLGPVASAGPMCAKSMFVQDGGILKKALQHDMIVVIPSMARPDDISPPTPVKAYETVLALTRYLTGLQSNTENAASQRLSIENPQVERLASVERVIILDPIGGTPTARRPDVTHRLINLKQEYDTLLDSLKTSEASYCEKTKLLAQDNTHAENLSLAKTTLDFLPTSSSVLITTPLAAANIGSDPPEMAGNCATNPSLLGFHDMVITRKQKNPLLHNLLTNRPAFSPSLPLQRIHDEKHEFIPDGRLSSATLVKRGMPVTIYPEMAGKQQCHTSQPGSQRLRLTDNTIDLARLVYLIENSFSRKLNVQDYVERINDNLAAIIIAGDYEGAAILTWELPAGVSKEAARRNNRYVPYLDKFAVLKSQQGGSSVADIVFNAMVQDCFPNGVCWRSRKDNPVNKWYFERSRGTCQLSGSNWAMFWTTTDFKDRRTTLEDYESVCRAVQPSWADIKHAVGQ